MCYRYAISNATGIRKWSKHLTEFPMPKFMTLDCAQQWQSVLVDICSHLCLTDVSFKTMLINTGPRPFTLHCMKPWGCVPNDPDTCPRADLINDILANVHVLAAADRLTPCRWLVHRKSHPSTRRVLLAHSEKALLVAGYSFSLYTATATGVSGISLPLVVLHDSSSYLCRICHSYT